ncbi:S8 family serine peptidase [Sphingomonas sp. MMS24-J45]|uniref:S8 family serine peptidase n=1 Tax=Sphingomonas sp. MMS24-J45 TaxID=3238806 RepID=UPI00385099D0
MAMLGVQAPVPVRAQTTDPVKAIEQATGTGAKPGDIVVELRGGKVAENLAAILDTLIGVPDALPIETVSLDDHPRLCDLLTARGYPPGCDALLVPIRRLNPGLDLNALQPGSQIRLPQVTPTTLAGFRALSTVQAKSATVGKGFRWSPNRLVANVLGRSLLRYTAYRLLIPSSDDVHAEVILAAIRAKELSNVDVEYAPRLQPPPPAFALADTAPVPCGPASLLDYATLLEGDSNLATLTALPKNAPPTDVWLVDTTLTSTPDLPEEDDASAPGPEGCVQASFDRPRHHATHLAGIVGSRNGVRFRGLSPGARVHSIPYLKPDPSDPRQYAYVDAAPGFALRGQLETVISGSSERRPVFLVATSFPANASEMDAVRKSRQSRAGVAPNNVFFDYRPIVVASAGQQRQRSDGSFDPADAVLDKIAPIYSNSPQNLGDLSNVVLVTACGKCSRSETHLMNGAYRPLPGTPSTIPLIAPAGPIPGWVGHGEISQASGTSQAAAYVAGVVAGMESRYNYSDAWKIKYRLMATAWPLVDNGRNDSETIEAVGAGLVEPLRAWLDPSKHWVKLRGGSWEPVRLSRWSGKALEVFLQDGSSQIVAAPSIAHIVRVSEPTAVQRQYALLMLERAPTDFRKLGPVSFDGSVTIERCDGADPIALEDIEELIFAIPRLTERANGCR